MFLFAPEVPESIHLFLIPYLQAWIDHNDLPLFGVETIRYGLVTFRRDVRVADGMPIVSPAGEVDLAALLALSQEQVQGEAHGTF